MPQVSLEKTAKPLAGLRTEEFIGGICAVLVVILACVRIFVLHLSVDDVLENVMTIAGTVLSLVVLTAAVRIMLSTKKTRSFGDVLTEECEEIGRRYGALIKAADGQDPGKVDGLTYLIADNVDAVFTSDSEEWHSLVYMEKFAFSADFQRTRTIHYYVNHANMAARAGRLGDGLALTARLLARDTAVIVQRSFSDIITAHAMEVTQEKGRAVVTIRVNSTETVKDAERIAELLNYLLFLHFVAT